MKLTKIICILSCIICAISLIADFQLPQNYEFFDIAKPITIFQYSGFLSVALLLQISKNTIKKLNKEQLQLLIILGFLIILASFFETLWAYNYWFSSYLIAVQNGAPHNAKKLDSLEYTPNPDLQNPYQVFRNKQGLGKTLLNNMAKRDVLVFMISIYFVYFLHSLLIEKKQQKYTKNK